MPYRIGEFSRITGLTIKALRLYHATVRELPGGKMLSLVHRGSYKSLGTSYERLIREIRERERGLCEHPSGNST